MTTKRMTSVLCLLLASVLAGGCGRSAPEDTHAGHQHAAGESHATVTSAPPATCATHGAPKEICFLCDPALRDPGRLWCKEHGRYEDRCWECHPDARDKNRLYCDEHGLYEDECFICHPEAAKKPPVAKTASERMKCVEHGVFEDECGICRPEVAGQLKPGESMKVRLPSSDSAKLAGIETATATADKISDGIECYAELAFNQNKLAHLASPVSGILSEVVVDLGESVKEGQTVARIWSASIAESVAKAVLSHQTLARERKLHADGIAAAKDVQEAEAAHRAACQQARTLGFSEADIDALGKRPDEAVLLDVRAPFAGEIIERSAVRGSLVDAGKSLFTVADRSTMWAMLDIPEVHLSRVRVGQDVDLSLDALPGRHFTGKLTWIASRVDEHTRMARARAEVANTDGSLRDRMFARARIIAGRSEHALLLPPAAIQRVDNMPIVFVKQADDLYDARAVRLGAKHDGHVEILAGLRPDEMVVVSQAFSVKSQMLISRLGASCCAE